MTCSSRGRSHWHEREASGCTECWPLTSGYVNLWCCRVIFFFLALWAWGCFVKLMCGLWAVWAVGCVVCVGCVGCMDCVGCWLCGLWAVWVVFFAISQILPYILEHLWNNRMIIHIHQSTLGKTKKIACKKFFTKKKTKSIVVRYNKPNVKFSHGF